MAQNLAVMSSEASTSENTNIKMKRQNYTFEFKKRVLEEIETGAKKKEIAKKYNIANSTLSTFLKNREKFDEPINQNRKKLKYGKYGNVEKSLYEWHQSAKVLNMQINDSLIKEKACYYAQLYGQDTFTPNQIWLHRFKERFGISSGKRCSAFPIAMATAEHSNAMDVGALTRVAPFSPTSGDDEEIITSRQKEEDVFYISEVNDTSNEDTIGRFKVSFFLVGL